jgi:fumarylacetoacetate (FAA) hydrolase
MKLATLRNGQRDGALIIVSRDLTRAVAAAPIAATIIEALEHWDEIVPQLAVLSTQLNQGTAPGAFAFDQHACAAPLPRANQ